MEDVTETFVRGAQAALDTARVRRSDGRPQGGEPVMRQFRDVRRLFASAVGGTGVTAALLSRNGIPVFSEMTLAGPRNTWRALSDVG
jgi:uncharacterized protein YbbK (DUF523 family)